MSNYLKESKHPITGKWEVAEWLDNHFGHYNYGVRFADGQIFDVRGIVIETRERALKKKKPIHQQKVEEKAPTTSVESDSKARITCLNINCPERTGGKCDVIERNHIMEKWESCDWQKDFEENFGWMVCKKQYGDCGCDINGHNLRAEIPAIKQFIDALLIKILAKCETAKDARACRHIIKDYILSHDPKEQTTS